MFDIRELQERVIFEAVRNSSDLETAEEIIYGHDGSALGKIDNVSAGKQI